MTPEKLEKRLVDFAVFIISICDSLPKTRAGNHLAGQLIRSGTSPALNYGEARSAESRKDFLHKIRIVLKELRETSVNLKIINNAKMLDLNDKIELAEKECDELISIFVKSAETAQRNIDSEKR